MRRYYYRLKTRRYLRRAMAPSLSLSARLAQYTI
jgi:hypothetical protein